MEESSPSTQAGPPLPTAPAVPAAGITFGFKAKTKDRFKVLSSGAAAGNLEEKEVLLSVSLSEGLQVKGGKKKVEVKELVIKCSENAPGGKTWGSRATKDDKEKDPKISQESKTPSASSGKRKDADELTEQAERELLSGATEGDHLGQETAGDQDQQVISGADPDSGHDRFRVSQIDDYDSIPVQGFGLGMLRGMGFKQGEGIGGFKKANVQCLEPVLRPKGLGLGAARPGDSGAAKANEAQPAEGEEKLELKNAAFVKIHSRKSGSQDCYGQVEGLDLDSARVFVKMAVGGEVKSVSENSVQVVSKKEYKTFSKVINKDLFDKYNEKQVKREEDWAQDRKREGSRSKQNQPQEKKPRRSESSSKKVAVKSDWARPQLRVRFIDKKYKGGRYYKCKMVISDVPAIGQCVLQTEEGRVLEEISPNDLETLVPREKNSLIMILRGSARGEIAEIVERDKSRYIVVVQTVPDRDQILKLDFDDVCEYVGEVPMMFG